MFSISEATTACLKEPMIGSLEFQRLPAKERARLAVLIPVLAALATAKPLGPALRIAEQYCAHLPGAWKWKTLETHLGIWRKHGDWKKHIDKRCAKFLQEIPAEQTALRSDEFLNYFHALVEDNKRSTAAAIRELKKRWKQGQSIPGFGSWREWFAVMHPGMKTPAECPGYPDGWHERTLHRVKPSASKLALARQGFKRHAELTAYTPRTTRNLRCLELLVADDFRLDVMCVVPKPITIGGRTFKEGVRAVIGMVLMDVASRKIIGWCLRPSAPDEEGVKSVMGRADLAFLAGQALLEHGLPQGYPIEYYTEHATATFTKETRGWMAATFGDRVRFKSTGLFDNALAEYGYSEGGGKAWHKGWIEAFFPRMHNELASLPGQIGSNYTKKPGELEDRLRTAENLIKAAAKLSERAVKDIRFPFPTYEQVCEVFSHFIRESNARTDHALEGFDEVMMWRSSDAECWREDMDALATLPQQAVLAAQYQNRKQSPAERWMVKRTAGTFSPVHMSAVAPMLSTGEPVGVRRGMIRIERDGQPHLFHSTAREHDALLAEGARFIGHWSWLFPDELHLYTEGSLAYAGALPRVNAVDVMDMAAIGESSRRIRAAVDLEVQDYRKRHTAEAEKNASDRNHNAAVLRGEYLPERIADRIRNYDMQPAVPVTAPAPKPAKPAPKQRRVRDISEL